MLNAGPTCNMRRERSRDLAGDRVVTGERQGRTVGYAVRASGDPPQRHPCQVDAHRIHVGGPGCPGDLRSDDWAEQTLPWDRGRQTAVKVNQTLRR